MADDCWPARTHARGSDGGAHRAALLRCALRRVRLDRYRSLRESPVPDVQLCALDRVPRPDPPEAVPVGQEAFTDEFSRPPCQKDDERIENLGLPAVHPREGRTAALAALRESGVEPTKGMLRMLGSVG